MIVLAPLPVAIDRPEATAAVVTFSAPVTALAARSPCSPVTVNPADPDRLNPAMSESAVALTVTVSLLKLSVIEVAAEPVVMAMRVVGRIPRGHVQCPGQRWRR